MLRTAWFLVLSLSSVLRSVISGNDDNPPHINSGLSKNAITKFKCHLLVGFFVMLPEKTKFCDLSKAI